MSAPQGTPTQVAPTPVAPVSHGASVSAAPVPTPPPHAANHPQGDGPAQVAAVLAALANVQQLPSKEQVDHYAAAHKALLHTLNSIDAV